MDEADRARLRAQAVVEQLPTALWRHALDGNARHVERLVQGDPEREVVGQAAVDRHDALRVGADEEQLARREVAPASDQEQDNEQREQRRNRLAQTAEWPA